MIIDQKGRSHIPHPRIIAGHFYHPDLRRKLFSGILILCLTDTHRHRSKAADCFCHLGIRFLGRFSSVSPVIRPLRPQHPHPFLGFKLPRHVKSVLFWCCIYDSFCHNIPHFLILKKTHPRFRRHASLHILMIRLIDIF